MYLPRFLDLVSICELPGCVILIAYMFGATMRMIREAWPVLVRSFIYLVDLHILLRQ